MNNRLIHTEPIVSNGRIIGIREVRTNGTVVYVCLHDHAHRTEAAFGRCVDGASGAATGSRLARR